MRIKLSQLDALQEIVNGGVKQSVVVLNEILSYQICLQVFRIEILSLQQASQELQQRIGLAHVSGMRLPFTGTLRGNALLIFPIDSAARLVAALMQEEVDLPDLNAIRRGTLSEVGNIILNGVMAEISDALKQSLQYQIPFYFEGSVGDLLSRTNLEDSPTILLAQTRLTCNLLQFTGDIVLVFTVRSFDTLLLKLNIT